MGGEEGCWSMKILWWEWLLVVVLVGVVLVIIFGCGTAGKAGSETRVSAGPGSTVEAPSKAETAPVSTSGGPSIVPKVESPTGAVTIPVSAPQYGLDPERAKDERMKLKLWAGGLGAAATVVGGFLLIVAGAVLKQAKFSLFGLVMIGLGLAGGLATWFFA